MSDLPNPLYRLGEEFAMSPDDWLDRLVASGALVEVTDGEIREVAYQVWLKDQTRLIDKVLSDEALAPSAAIGDGDE